MTIGDLCLWLMFYYCYCRCQAVAIIVTDPVAWLLQSAGRFVRLIFIFHSPHGGLWRLVTNGPTRDYWLYKKNKDKEISDWETGIGILL